MSLNRQPRTKKTCQHCQFSFASQQQHYVLSPNCDPALPKSASGSTVITESVFYVTQTPDDLGGVITAASLESSHTRVVDDELNDDDLMELFLSECNHPSSPTLLQAASTTAIPPIPRQPPPTPAGQEQQHNVPVHLTPVLATPSLDTGEAYLLPPQYDKGRFCFTNQDRAMMRLYNLGDQAGAPRFLVDQILSQVKHEMNRNQFDPRHASITKRDAFMARMHRKFPSPPPERIQVQLESFPEPVTVYRFDVIEQLKQHLIRFDLYGDLNKLNVHPDHRWDQSILPPSTHMREVTDGSWYKKAVSKYIGGQSTHLPPSDLEDTLSTEDQYASFVITLEQYQDSTGTDNKESYSLEPVVMSTGLLKAEFNANPSSRFIIGYIPSLSNHKSSAAQTKKASSLAGFGGSVRDYHKCLSIILEPLVKAQIERPLMDVRLGNQIRRVRTKLLLGTVLGDGKSNDMLCGRVGSFTNTLRLSRATFTPSYLASETNNTFHWIHSNVIERVTRAAMFDSESAERSQWNHHLHDLTTEKIRKQHKTAAKRRARMSTEILKKALGSHAVKNAFFYLEFASDYGIFGHTLADVMHLLEEGLMKYLLSVFLDNLSSTVLANLDKYVAKLLGAKANRSFGRREYPRVNFTRGYSKLTLLSSEERVGELLALVLVMHTDRGRLILEERFADDRRKKSCDLFSSQARNTGRQ